MSYASGYRGGVETECLYPAIFVTYYWLMLYWAHTTPHKAPYFDPGSARAGLVPVFWL